MSGVAADEVAPGENSWPEEEVVEKEVEIGYENVVGQDSISRFANTSKNRNKNN